MASLNQITIIGNLGHPPSIRHFPDGTPVAEFSVATSKKWTDKNTGAKREKTQWHKVKLMRALAEVAQKYLDKGSSVCIVGEVEYDKYTDRQGIERHKTEIIGHTLQLLGRRKDDAAHNTQSTAPSATQQQNQQPPQHAGNNAYAQASNGTGTSAYTPPSQSAPITDEDIPF